MTTGMSAPPIWGSTMVTPEGQGGQDDDDQHDRTLGVAIM